MGSFGGSGGGTGQLVSPDSTAIHNLLLKGEVAVATAWPTGYTGTIGPTHYSTLGFIKYRGLTDVGGNPFEGVSGYDPEINLDLIQEGLDEFKEKLEALTPSTDFATDVATATSEHTALATALDFDDALNTIISRISIMAGGEASTMLVKAFQEAKAQLPEIITRARTNAVALSSESVYTTLTQVKNILDQAVTEYDDFALTHDEVTADVTDARSDFEPAIDSLYTLATNIARNGAAQLISMAYSTALSMVGSPVVDKAVASFEKNARPAHLRNVSRFAGGMADVNAVQSSTFVIGMALIEADFQRDVNAHRSGLEVQFYRDVVAAFIDVEGRALTEYLKLYIQEVLVQTDLYKVLRNLRTTEGNYATATLQTFSEMLRGFSSEHVRTYEAEKLAELNVTQSLGDRQANIFLQGFNGYLDSLVRARLSEEDRKARFVLSGAESIQGRVRDELSFYRENAVLVDEVNKTKIIATSEEYEKNLDYDVRAAMWDMSLFQQAGNVLSSVTGSVVTNTDKPTRAQSALSAGLGLASIAASIPGVGAPGAAAGFLIGGVAGLIANQ